MTMFIIVLFIIVKIGDKLMFISSRLDTSTGVYSYNGILYKHESELELCG